MDILESIKNTSENGVDIGKKYVEASFEYGKLKAFQLLAYTVSYLVKLFLIGGLLFGGLIFLSVAAAMALGEYFSNILIGYLCVGAFYILLSLITFLSRKFIDNRLLVRISKQFFE